MIIVCLDSMQDDCINPGDVGGQMKRSVLHCRWNYGNKLIRQVYKKVRVIYQNAGYPMRSKIWTKPNLFEDNSLILRIKNCLRFHII